MNNKQLLLLNFLLKMYGRIDLFDLFSHKTELKGDATYILSVILLLGNVLIQEKDHQWLTSLEISMFRQNGNHHSEYICHILGIVSLHKCHGVLNSRAKQRALTSKFCGSNYWCHCSVDVLNRQKSTRWIRSFTISRGPILRIRNIFYGI